MFLALETDICGQIYLTSRLSGPANCLVKIWFTKQKENLVTSQVKFESHHVTSLQEFILESKYKPVLWNFYVLSLHMHLGWKISHCQYIVLNLMMHRLLGRSLYTHLLACRHWCIKLCKECIQIFSLIFHLFHCLPALLLKQNCSIRKCGRIYKSFPVFHYAEPCVLWGLDLGNFRTRALVQAWNEGLAEIWWRVEYASVCGQEPGTLNSARLVVMK